MYPAAGQSVEEDRQRGHQRFTFAGRHFGDFALVEDHSSDELDVVVDHIPGDGVATRNPSVFVHGPVPFDDEEVFSDGEVSVEVCGGYFYGGVLHKAASRIFHDRKSLREELRKLLFFEVEDVFLYFVDFCPDLFALGELLALYRGFKIGDAVFFALDVGLDLPSHLGRSGTQLVVGPSFYFLKLFVDFDHIRLKLFEVFVGFVAENLGQQIIDSHYVFMLVSECSFENQVLFPFSLLSRLCRLYFEGGRILKMWQMTSETLLRSRGMSIS